RASPPGARALPWAAPLNIAPPNAGIGLGAIIGGLGIRQWGLEVLGLLATGIALLAVLLVLAMIASARRQA
ncbi:MFS transporter, partial [Pseudomonas fulva]|nr:MFS transporter [Pseudomonas fulva]